MIYLISHQNEYLKIGYTKNINKRLAQLQVSSPVKLEVLHLIKGDVNLEKELHLMFKEYSSNGEWFYYNEEIINYFKSKDCLMWENGFTEYEKPPLIGYLKNERLKRNMSLQQVAEMYGCTAQSMLEIEKRERQGGLTLSILYKMAKIYNKKFEYRIV